MNLLIVASKIECAAAVRQLSPNHIVQYVFNVKELEDRVAKDFVHLQPIDLIIFDDTVVSFPMPLVFGRELCRIPKAILCYYPPDHTILIVGPRGRMKEVNIWQKHLMVDDCGHEQMLTIENYDKSNLRMEIDWRRSLEAICKFSITSSWPYKSRGRLVAQT